MLNVHIPADTSIRYQTPVSDTRCRYDARYQYQIPVIKLTSQLQKTNQPITEIEHRKCEDYYEYFFPCGSIHKPFFFLFFCFPYLFWGRGRSPSPIRAEDRFKVTSAMWADFRCSMDVSFTSSTVAAHLRITPRSYMAHASCRS